MAASWLFLVEPAGPACCRVISRYRCDTSGDLLTRLQFGPAIIEPVGFAMDRRMLTARSSDSASTARREFQQLKALQRKVSRFLARACRQSPVRPRVTQECPIHAPQ